MHVDAVLLAKLVGLFSKVEEIIKTYIKQNWKCQLYYAKFPPRSYIIPVHPPKSAS